MPVRQWIMNFEPAAGSPVDVESGSVISSTTRRENNVPFRVPVNRHVVQHNGHYQNIIAAPEPDATFLNGLSRPFHDRFFQQMPLYRGILRWRLKGETFWCGRSSPLPEQQPFDARRD